MKESDSSSGGNNKESSEQVLGNKLASNLAAVAFQLGDSQDIIIREFSIGSTPEISAAIIYIDGLSDKTQIDRDILSPLLNEAQKTESLSTPVNFITLIQKKIVPVGEIKTKSTVTKIVDSVLSGDTVLLIDGFDEALIISTRGWEKRAIEEPASEVVVRGPREGFTETLRTNTSIIRRKIRNPNLTFETINLGQKTKTDVCIVYLKGLTNQGLIKEVKRRLNNIATDSILESGYIEEFIQDAPFSPFPTINYTERPDVVAGKILEGRVAIITNGTPVVLTVPTLFIELFQSPEDYYIRSYYASLIRWVRYTAFAFNLLSPAIYVALIMFHHELIPTPLLISMAAAREGLPFSAVVEAVGMGLIFEILREAGVRQPRPIGQAVSIVGSLVIGQAAISAGIVGAPMVIVVALTAIASFVTPNLSNLSAILRLFLTILAGFSGAFGIMIGLLVTLVHLVSLRSFGISYFAPLTPMKPWDLKDVMVRVPWWAMFKRSRSIWLEDRERQKFRLIPEPPEDRGTE